MKNTINKNDLFLYLVKEGVVTKANENQKWDGISSILVLASDGDYALRTADAYDEDLIQADNYTIFNKIISCFYLAESKN